MNNVAEDWSRYLGQLKVCPKIGQLGVGHHKDYPKWGSSGQGSLNVAPKGGAHPRAAQIMLKTVTAMSLCCEIEASPTSEFHFLLEFQHFIL